VWAPALVGLLLLGLFVLHAMRDHDAALLDLRHFGNRTFTACSIMNALVNIAGFGGMLLLPLYFQAVRGESALDTGLLLVPQGIGAIIAMSISGQLSDRVGVGRIVPVGLTAVSVSFLALTQLGADTSYWLLGAEMFVLGLGMGASMMPLFSGAMQTLPRSAYARANTTLNINSRISAAVGSAMLSVLLVHALTERLGHGPGGGIGERLSPEVRTRVAPSMADAYASTFWWAFALVAVSLVLALVLLPRHRPTFVSDPEEPGPLEAQEPVAVGAHG
jgi:MFS family permease